MMKALLLAATLATLTLSVTFESLYNKQLKTSYGYEIYKHYHDTDFGNNSLKKFKGQSLIFLAPWRERGKDIVTKFINKFDYFSPCYYDLEKAMDPERIIMKTSEHYSQDYMKQLKNRNPNISIMPRLYVHGMYGDVFYLAGSDQTQMSRLRDFVRQILLNPLYDGIVFSSTFLTPNNKWPWSMKEIVKQIREEVDVHGKKLFITLEGVDDKAERAINKKKARELMDMADKVLVTNYDYPKGSSGGIVPVSPMKWIKENFDFYCEVYSKAKLVPKLIMTIPLYGYYIAIYGKYESLEATELLKKLQDEKQAKLEWADEYEECVLSINQFEYLFYPCLHFLDKRLRYFEEMGVGVAGFDAGTALEILFQMF